MTAAFDCHGFAIFPSEDKPDSERCHLYSEKKFTRTEILAWKKIISQWQSAGVSPEKMKALVNKGVPHQLRATLWKLLLESEQLEANSTFDYKAESIKMRKDLVDIGISEYGDKKALDGLAEAEAEWKLQGHQPDIQLDAYRLILLDVGRSYPTHQQFMGNTPKATEGRASLFRLLAMYVRYNQRVGYCQGMSYIAGMLLMHMEEEEAFWCLVSLFERQKYLLGYYDHNMARIKKQAMIFDRLLKQKLPRLHMHLEKCGVAVIMFVAPWFMCLFTNLPCWDTVLTIWDMLLLEGGNLVFSVGLSILSIMHDQLLALDELSAILPRLLRLHHSIVQHDILMPVLLDTVVEAWEIRLLYAIIQDEEEDQAVAHGHRKRHRQDKENQTSHVFEFTGRDGIPTKRRRVQNSSQPSVFTRIMNIFTPKLSDPAANCKDSRLDIPSGRARKHTQQRKMKRFNSKVSASETTTLQTAFSLDNSETEGVSFRELRSSPRLTLTSAASKVNTPAEHQPISGVSEVQQSVKFCNTSHLLRKTERLQVLADCSYNPNIEKQAITRGSWKMSSPM